MIWTHAYEQACQRLVATVCGGGPPSAREDAWRRLLASIGEPIEGWAARSPVLRRADLAGEDDVRAVLLGTIERLAADDFANLRDFLARRRRGAGDELDRLVRCADDEAPGDDGDGHDDSAHTPLRAWLITLVKFVERDHLRARLGWGTSDKRTVNTNAERLPTGGGDLGERPPVTDALTVAAVLAEVREAVAGFPAEMRAALELWSEDVGFDDIASRLGLDPGVARALVRAAQARLRERFRGRVPELFGR